MKRSLFITVFYLFSLFCFSQGGGTLPSKPKNFSSFSYSRNKIITDELLKHTPERFQANPDFGVLPVDVGCADCMELIQERTENTRYYIKKGSNGKEFYVQKGYFPLNYYDESGNLRAINAALEKTMYPTLFSAANQYMPTSMDTTTGESTIKTSSDFSFQYNKQQELLYDNGTTLTSLGNYHPSTTDVGDDGSIAHTAWTGIDRRTTFALGAIETDFILNQPPPISGTTGWLIFRDKFILPSGYTIKHDSLKGHTTAENNWAGDLCIVDANGNAKINIRRPIWFDASGSQGVNIPNGYTVPTDGVSYKINQQGNQITLDLYASVNYLLLPSLVYPVTIDPLVTGVVNTVFAGTQCTTYNGTCAIPSANTSTVAVTVPGNSTITGASYTVQYTALSAGCPCLPMAMNQRNCITTDACFRMTGPCGNGTGPWTLNCPGGINTRAACTNWIVTSVPIVDNATVTCTAPQCANYSLSMTLNMMRAYCNCSPACGTACIAYNQWTITITGHTLELLGNAVGSGTSNITGSCNVNTTLDPTALYGVPSYTYSWNPGGAATSTLVANQGTNGTFTYIATVTDACGIAQTATFNFTVADCPLPIELLNFDAVYNGKSVDTKWSTASETNNDYFTVERSTDGINYAFIGTVPSSAPGGNSTSLLSYFLNDANVKTGTYYYRLKQTDFNGAYQYSNIVPVTILDENDVFTVVPNPATNSADIIYQVYDDVPSLLKIMDAQGKLVFSERIENLRGKRKHTINISKLSNGLYFIRLTTSAKTYSVKLVKQ